MSARTSLVLVSSRTPCRRATGSAPSYASCTTSASATRPRVRDRAPALIRDSSKRSSTMPDSRSAWCPIRRWYSATDSGSATTPSESASAIARTEASGARRSWLIPATSSRRLSSTARSRARASPRRARVTSSSAASRAISSARTGWAGPTSTWGRGGRRIWIVLVGQGAQRGGEVGAALLQRTAERPRDPEGGQRAGGDRDEEDRERVAGHQHQPSRDQHADRHHAGRGEGDDDHRGPQRSAFGAAQQQQPAAVGDRARRD